MINWLSLLPSGAKFPDLVVFVPTSWPLITVRQYISAYHQARKAHLSLRQAKQALSMWINYSFGWKWMRWWIEYSFVSSIMPPKSWFLIRHHPSCSVGKETPRNGDVIRWYKQHITAAGPLASLSLSRSMWKLFILHLSVSFFIRLVEAGREINERASCSFNWGMSFQMHFAALGWCSCVVPGNRT